MQIGVLELLAQSLSYCYGKLERGLRTMVPRDVLVKPCILQAGNASCTFSATEQACDSLSCDFINQVGNEFPYIIVHECPDQASANVRKVLATRAKLDGRVMHSWTSCTVHAAQRIVVTGTQEDRLIGDIHAIAFTCNLTSNREKLLAALRRLVFAELHIVYAEPDPAWRRHSAAVLNASLLRQTNRIRGSLGGGRAVLESHEAERRRETKQKILKYLNGDIRHDCCRHYEVFSRTQASSQPITIYVYMFTLLYPLPCLIYFAKPNARVIVLAI